ncbi:MAG: hypothetical protein FH748_12055 [Balneolaceae bacterium]|nr:hypothetical protein [Balneolaceae bacterium]
MKRSFLVITIIVASSFDVQAQAPLFMHYRSGLMHQEQTRIHQADHIRKELRELNKLQREVDQFVILTNNREWAKAGLIKMTIIRKMKDEIHQTRLKMNYFERLAQGKDGRSTKYSKRNTKELSRRYKGRSTYEYRKKSLILKRRYKRQQRYMHELLRTRIGSGISAWRNAKYNERSMLKFEDTLRNEIHELREEYPRKN